MPKAMINGVLTDIPFDAIFADDGTTPLTLAQQAVQGGRTFTEEDVARIRQEEKDKLYSQIERNNEELTNLREQVGSLTAAEQRRAAQLEQEQQALEAEARRKEEEELDAKALIARKEQEWQDQLAQTTQTWEQKFNEAEQQRQAALAAAAKEREFGELRDYTLAAVEANKENIAPQLLGWISGNSKEEVDAAITRAIQTTDQIAAEMQEAFGQQQPGTQVVTQQQPAVPPALPGTRPTIPVGADPAAQNQQLTAEQISNMPLSEYAKLRPALGIGGQSSDRGLFG